MWGSEFPKPCEAVNFPNLVDHLRGCPLYRLASFWAGHWLSQICGVTQKGYVALLCCNTAGSQWLHSAGFPWQSHKWCAGQSQESSSRFFSGELHANGSGWTVEPHISTPCIANCSLTIIMVRNSGHTRTQTWIICEVVLYVYERERERATLSLSSLQDKSDEEKSKEVEAEREKEACLVSSGVWHRTDAFYASLGV